MDTRIYEPASGGKTTMFYFEPYGDTQHGFYLDIVPDGDYMIYSDEELTKPVEEEEFMDAYRSGTVVVACNLGFQDLVAHFIVSAVADLLTGGIRIFVSALNVPEPPSPSAKTYYISTYTEWNTSGRAYIHRTPEISSTNHLSDAELATLASENPYNVWLADIDSKDSSGRMRKYSIIDTQFLEENYGSRWVFYINAAESSESGEIRTIKHFG